MFLALNICNICCGLHVHMQCYNLLGHNRVQSDDLVDKPQQFAVSKPTEESGIAQSSWACAYCPGHTQLATHPFPLIVGCAHQLKLQPTTATMD